MGYEDNDNVSEDNDDLVDDEDEAEKEYDAESEAIGAKLFQSEQSSSAWEEGRRRQLRVDHGGHKLRSVHEVSRDARSQSHRHQRRQRLSRALRDRGRRDDNSAGD